MADNFTAQSQMFFQSKQAYAKSLPAKREFSAKDDEEF